MGRLAVELLAARIDDPDLAEPTQTIRLPMMLIERESTGPAPKVVAPAHGASPRRRATPAAGRPA